MGQTLVFWSERSDSESVILYSAPFDASSMESGTVFLGILSVGTVTVSIVAEESIDPNNPNSWSTVGGTAIGSANGNFKALVGGQTTGTTNQVGPFLRLRATIAVTSGGIVWTGGIVLR
jgi:hypothetical protein